MKSKNKSIQELLDDMTIKDLQNDLPKRFIDIENKFDVIEIFLLILFCSIATLFIVIMGR
jgi:hypothetical protein